MFERFTDRARRVVVLAQEEARMLNHNYIGTEHLLLGLVSEGKGVACEALGKLGISLPAVRGQVEEIIGRGQNVPTGHIPFTPRAKKVLELSLREGLQLGHNYIGTEHLLLGVVREGEGVAAQVLVKLGADLGRVRQTVITILSERGVAEAETAGSGQPAGLRSRQGWLPEHPPAWDLSPGARRSIDLALAVSTWLAHGQIQPSDLLWGLLRGADPETIRVLTELGLDLDAARATIADLMAQAAVQETPPSSEAPSEEDEPPA